MSALTHRRPAAKRDSATRRSGGLSGMLWLTWRQHRWAVIASLILTAVFVAWMVYLTNDLMTLYHQCNDTQCSRSTPEGAALWAGNGPIRQTETLGLAVRYVPLLIGMFLGVPLLAREHEQRTLLLAWSQDVSPMRWLWTKLALLGLYVAALTAALSVAGNRLAHAYAINIGGGLFDSQGFLVTGMLPLATGICWFAIGVAIGAIVRRILPAIFATMVGYIGLMLVVQWRYPTLLKPLSVYLRTGQPSPLVADPNGLIVNGLMQIGPDSTSNVFDSPGHVVTYTDLLRMCPELSNPSGTMIPDCAARNHLMTYVTYQPSSRIPVFHLLLASGYLGLTAVALAAVWLIVRRTNLSAG